MIMLQVSECSEDSITPASSGEGLSGPGHLEQVEIVRDDDVEGDDDQLMMKFMLMLV